MLRGEREPAPVPAGEPDEPDEPADEPDLSRRARPQRADPGARGRGRRRPQPVPARPAGHRQDDAGAAAAVAAAADDPARGDRGHAPALDRRAARRRAGPAAAVPLAAPHDLRVRAGRRRRRPPTPGEATLAHHGVLFLDELSEFTRPALEALRQPLEDGRVTIVRAQRVMVFPTRVTLVAASNPCPCGMGESACRCSAADLARHQRRLSGPLLDRIDVSVTVGRPSASGAADQAAPPSARVRERIVAARERQTARLARHGPDLQRAARRAAAARARRARRRRPTARSTRCTTATACPRAATAASCASPARSPTSAASDAVRARPHPPGRRAQARRPVALARGMSARAPATMPAADRPDRRARRPGSTSSGAGARRPRACCRCPTRRSSALDRSGASPRAHAAFSPLARARARSRAPGCPRSAAAPPATRSGCASWPTRPRSCTSRAARALERADAVAIVGARRGTAYGLEVARSLGRGLTRRRACRSSRAWRWASTRRRTSARSSARRRRRAGRRARRRRRRRLPGFAPAPARAARRARLRRLRAAAGLRRLPLVLRRAQPPDRRPRRAHGRRRGDRALGLAHHRRLRRAARPPGAARCPVPSRRASRPARTRCWRPAPASCATRATCSTSCSARPRPPRGRRAARASRSSRACAACSTRSSAATAASPS